jgi:hypothetical protein
MQMNKLKYQRIIPLLLLVAVSMAVLAAGTDEQAAETTPVVTPSENPQQTSPQAGDVDPETPEAVKNAPAASAATPKTIKEFKPTEKIEADSAVSFPVDI